MQRQNFKPGTCLHHPRADFRRSQGVREFRVHGRRDEDAPVELRKNVNRFNQDKIVERRCVSDNRRHLQAELAVAFAIAFEVFEGVFEFDAVVFQEAVDLRAGLETKQLTQQGGGDFARAVGFEGEGFQSGAGEILALRGESREKLVGKRDGDVLHGFRILEESVKSTGRLRKAGKKSKPAAFKSKAAAGESECWGSRGRVTAGTEIGQRECEIAVGDGMNFRSGAL